MRYTIGYTKKWEQIDTARTNRFVKSARIKTAALRQRERGEERVFFRIIKLWVILFTVWIVLNESAATTVLVQGAVFSAAAILLTSLFVGLPDRKIRIGFLPILRYMALLVADIVVSGVLAVKDVCTGDINIELAEVETNHEDELQATLFANGITLTPGMVTVEKKGKKLLVLCLNTTKKEQLLAKKEVVRHDGDLS